MGSLVKKSSEYRRGKTRRIQTVVLREIKRMYKKGMSCRDIHEKLDLGISPSSVTRICRRMGVMRTHKQAGTLAKDKIEQGQIKYFVGRARALGMLRPVVEKVKK